MGVTSSKPVAADATVTNCNAGNVGLDDSKKENTPQIISSKCPMHQCSQVEPSTTNTNDDINCGGGGGCPVKDKGRFSVNPFTGPSEVKGLKPGQKLIDSENNQETPSLSVETVVSGNFI
jgi:hypothetical protein